MVDGTELFKVRWADYASEEDTWEPREQFDGLESILEFKQLGTTHEPLQCVTTSTI